ncbi:pheromone [Trametes versicolor FP-101664 SS1]|uniref:pheromone n=1 Tax=Trametes versicolor (strain FP-101664) TaxID=717944 RepID=UPI0004621981|nr:pheromone [Trametes versicolor FP-101664 SS1]EIW57102.1 pheromone [Trametes versicolor FP-101664 SS1]
MDEFAAPSFILASLESTESLSDSAPSSRSSSPTGFPSLPSPSDPPLDQEYITGNTSYSWCTIA